MENCETRPVTSRCTSPAVSPAKTQLVRLIPKKDHRELALAQNGISHYRDSDLVAVKALAESEQEIAVSIGTLTPGEYLLVVPRSGLQAMSGGYDFSIAVDHVNGSKQPGQENKQ